MTQDLKRVVVIAGSGVPAHMIAKLQEQGMTVVPQGAHREIGEDEVKLVLGEDKGPWIDEAGSITPEMFGALSDRSSVSKRKARLLRGTR